jgi:hypothetical protein
MVPWTIWTHQTIWMLPRRSSSATWGGATVASWQVVSLHQALGDIPPAEFEALLPARTEAITSTIMSKATQLTRSSVKAGAAEIAAARPPVDGSMRCLGVSSYGGPSEKGP